MVQGGQNLFVVGLILNDPAAMTLWRRSIFAARLKPQLTHAIQAEVFLQIRIGRYSLGYPILTRQLPPCSPFDDGQAFAHIALEHYGLKAFSSCIQKPFAPFAQYET